MLRRVAFLKYATTSLTIRHKLCERRCNNVTMLNVQLELLHPALSKLEVLADCGLLLL